MLFLSSLLSLCSTRWQCQPLPDECERAEKMTVPFFWRRVPELSFLLGPKVVNHSAHRRKYFRRQLRSLYASVVYRFLHFLALLDGRYALFLHFLTSLGNQSWSSSPDALGRKVLRCLLQLAHRIENRFSAGFGDGDD